MDSILSQIKKRLPEALSQIIRADSRSIEGKISDIAQTFGIEFEIEGLVNGKVAIFFTDPKLIADRFLEVTIGDTSAAESGEACHEVANQALGRLFGILSNIGEEVRLCSYGIPLDEGMEADWNKNATLLTSISTEGYGNVHMCITDQVNSTDTALPQQPSQNEVTADQSKLRVMIVDDSPVMCAFLKKVFTEANYDIVAIATDGIEAVEMFQKLRPDLTTLDIMMPKMRGTDVLKEIVQIDPNAVVIMASSIADAKTVMSCLKMGAKRYIVKPYDKDAVMIAVNKALNLKEN